jgi:hypothetical protein
MKYVVEYQIPAGGIRTARFEAEAMEVHGSGRCMIFYSDAAKTSIFYVVCSDFIRCVPGGEEGEE